MMNAEKWVPTVKMYVMKDIVNNHTKKKMKHHRAIQRNVGINSNLLLIVLNKRFVWINYNYWLD